MAYGLKAKRADLQGLVFPINILIKVKMYTRWINYFEGENSILSKVEDNDSVIVGTRLSL